MRMHRAKALAAVAVAESEIPTTTLAHSLIYSPGDRHLLWLERLGYLPVVPLVGRGIARTQPIWVEDAADCVLAALDNPPEGHARHELAGPETLTQHEVVRLVLAAAGRRRRALPLPLTGLRAALRAEETLAGPTALVTWDEAQLLAVEMLSETGTAGAEALGVSPRADVGGSGRWCAQGCAASICSASWSSRSSLSGLPTNWTPVGRPSAPNPTGSEIAGWPVMLNSAV